MFRIHCLTSRRWALLVHPQASASSSGWDLYRRQDRPCYSCGRPFQRLWCTFGFLRCGRPSLTILSTARVCWNYQGTSQAARCRSGLRLLFRSSSGVGLRSWKLPVHLLRPASALCCSRFSKDRCCPCFDRALLAIVRPQCDAPFLKDNRCKQRSQHHYCPHVLLCTGPFCTKSHQCMHAHHRAYQCC